MSLTLKCFRRHLSQFLIVLFVSISLGLISPQPVLASAMLDRFSHFLPEQVSQILSDKKLVAEADEFLGTTSETVCRAYADSLTGGDNSMWLALQKSAKSAVAVAGAVGSASANGAGSLAGYAGISAIVTKFGLGWLTTAGAHVMGHGVAGAAATSVMTSAVGGPVVMGSLLIGGAGLVTFGTYKVGKLFAAKKLEHWAEASCEAASGVTLVRQ